MMRKILAFLVVVTSLFIGNQAFAAETCSHQGAGDPIDGPPLFCPGEGICRNESEGGIAYSVCVFPAPDACDYQAAGEPIGSSPLVCPAGQTCRNSSEGGINYSFCSGSIVTCDYQAAGDPIDGQPLTCSGGQSCENGIEGGISYSYCVGGGQAPVWTPGISSDGSLEGRFSKEVLFDIHSISNIIQAVIGVPGGFESAPTNPIEDENGNIEEAPLISCNDYLCAMKHKDAEGCIGNEDYLYTNIGLNLMQPFEGTKRCEAVVGNSSRMICDDNGTDINLQTFYDKYEEWPVWACFGDGIDDSAEIKISSSSENDSYEDNDETSNPFKDIIKAIFPSSRTGNFSLSKASDVTSNYVTADFDNPAAVLAQPLSVFGVSEGEESPDVRNLRQGGYMRIGLAEALCSCPGDSEDCAEDALNILSGASLEANEAVAAYKYTPKDYPFLSFAKLLGKSPLGIIDLVINALLCALGLGEEGCSADASTLDNVISEGMKTDISVQGVPGKEIGTGVQNLALSLADPTSQSIFNTGYGLDIRASDASKGDGMGTDFSYEGVAGAVVAADGMRSAVAEPSSFGPRADLVEPTFYEGGPGPGGFSGTCEDFRSTSVSLPTMSGVEGLVCGVAGGNSNDAQLLWGIMQIEGSPFLRAIRNGTTEMSCGDLILGSCGASQITGILIPSCIDTVACSQAAYIANDPTLQREITPDIACDVEGSLEYILQKRKSEVSWLTGQYQAANGTSPTTKQLYYMIAGRNYGLGVEYLTQPACSGAPAVQGCGGTNYCECAMDTFSFSCN